MSLRIRRGTENQRQGVTFDLGEIAYTTDTQKLYVGDGISQGGRNVLAATAGAGLTWNPTTQTLEVSTSSFNFTTSDIIEGSHLYYTPQRAQDAAAALFTAGIHQNISFVYDDVEHRINVTAAAGTGSNSGIISVQSDLAPLLGGPLGLNTFSILGTGDINIAGNIASTNSKVKGTFSNDYMSINQSVISADSHPFTVVSSNSELASFVGIVDGVGGFPWINQRVSQGTASVPTTTTAGTRLGGTRVRAFVGSGDAKTCSATISSWDTTAILTDQRPASTFSIFTNGGSSILREFKFESTGTFVAPVIQPGTYTTPAARSAAIPTPIPGMIVYVADSDGFGNPKFEGYIGGAAPGWVLLNT